MIIPILLKQTGKQLPVSRESGRVAKNPLYEYYALPTGYAVIAKKKLNAFGEFVELALDVLIRFREQCLNYIQEFSQIARNVIRHRWETRLVGLGATILLHLAEFYVTTSPDIDLMLFELITEEFAEPIAEFSTFNHFVNALAVLNQSEALSKQLFRQGFVRVLESIPRVMRQAAASAEFNVYYDEYADEMGRQLAESIE